MKGMQHCKNKQIRDLMEDLTKIVIQDDWERALKANTAKIGRFFRTNEYRLSVVDKKIINECMKYIVYQKEIRTQCQD